MPKLRKRAVPRYRELVDYCQTTFDETGTMPSYSTIAEALRFHDRSTVRRTVMRAEERGLLHRAGEWRGGKGQRTGQRLRLGAKP